MQMRRTATYLFGALFILGALGAQAIESTGHPRNYDRRTDFTEGFSVAPTADQLDAEARWRAAEPGLTVRYDETSGAARNISQRTGYLSDSLPEGSLASEVIRFAETHRDLLGLAVSDIAGHEVSDVVFSRVSGATHFYFQQTHDGLAVYNGQLQVNVNRDRHVVSLNNAFIPGLSQSINTRHAEIDAAMAVARAAEHLGVQLEGPPVVLIGPSGETAETLIDGAGISLEPISAQLMWLPVRRDSVRLVWNFRIHTLDQKHIFDLTVDAVDGLVWTRADWVASAQYKIYPVPVESPNHTSPMPPADARVTVVDPHDTTASPHGWHDTDGSAGPEYTIMRGNNVHSYDDRNGDGAPPSTEPDCGGILDCSFPIDLGGSPSSYIPAAVANLFYWNNIVHDIQYQYGFDEAAGNFQVNNYGNGGLGSDSVKAEAQDGGGTCNANFWTPPDGQRPRMQMYVCDGRDGDLDNGVVVHEYGHGISNRLVGGPSNVSCLGNSQQPGEGWSDWLALAYTAEVGDAGTDSRGIGTYLFGQPPNGGGIRPQPYSTDPSVNDYTYESIAGQSIPHGLGSVWAQATWEVYWALVDEYGFDPDFYNAMGGSGNQRAMLYVNEGMKYTSCNPTFLDARDGIIQATVDNYGGDDVCLVWEAFAAFGLGIDASTSGPNATTATNGFEIPLECQCTTPETPTGLTATPNGDNSISVQWSAAAGAGSYDVYRAIGTCPQTEYELIATGIVDTSYVDDTVSGDLDYSYVITAKDITGGCESSISNCADAQTTGACVEAPSFDGLQTVTNPGQSTCTLNLGWNAATAYCGGPVSYDIYRSDVPGFTPSVANRIAEDVVGTEYADASDISSGITYYYIVRAEDDFNGVAESNINEINGFPSGPFSDRFVDDFEGGNLGWAFSLGTPAASSGDFLIGDPVATTGNTGEPSQPGDDHTPSGVNCLYSDENPGGSAGQDDIDNGEVIATSPTFDGSNSDKLIIDAWRWFFNEDSDDTGDYYFMEVSNDAGGSWSEVENIPDSVTTTNSWTNVSYDLADILSPTADMKIRVRAADGVAAGDLVELAIDDIVITGFEACTSSSAPLPGSFGKIAPADGATDQPYDLQLSWNASLNATSYEYCVDTTDNDACDGGWTTANAGTSADLTGLANDTTYYWQARANNTQGSTEANGGTWWSFTTAALPLPGAFTKAGPEDGLTGQPTDLTIEWTTSAAATGYEYCIDMTDNDSCDGGWTYVGDVTSTDLSGLTESTEYFWQVRGTNTQGSTEADSGEWWSFITTPLLLDADFDLGNMDEWSVVTQ
jgi:extracellular elastinolytic metalloproteinase